MRGNVGRDLEALLELRQGCLSLPSQRDGYRFIPSEEFYYIYSDGLAETFRSAVRLGYYPWDAIQEGRPAVSPEEKTAIEAMIETCGGYLKDFISFEEVTGMRIAQPLDKGSSAPEYIMFVDGEDYEGLEIALRMSELQKVANRLTVVTNEGTADQYLEAAAKDIRRTRVQHVLGESTQKPASNGR